MRLSKDSNTRLSLLSHHSLALVLIVNASSLKLNVNRFIVTNATARRHAHDTHEHKDDHTERRQAQRRERANNSEQSAVLRSPQLQ